ncbi:MAG: NUDIX hydrolase [Candidatus Dormibacteria bacterium]
MAAGGGGRGGGGPDHHPPGRFLTRAEADGGGLEAAELDRLLRSLRPLEEEPEEVIEGSTLRLAAVLALIDPSQRDLPLLLLVRSSELRKHPGQVGLPGGSPAPKDGPLWRTALREAQEELNVPPEAVDLRGRATLVPTWNSGFVIAPFVGLLRHPIEPVAAAGEVAAFFWLPLLPDGVLATPVSRHVTVAEGSFQVPGYLHLAHFVWGATGAVVEDLLARMAPPAS